MDILGVRESIILLSTMIIKEMTLNCTCAVPDIIFEALGDHKTL